MVARGTVEEEMGNDCLMDMEVSFGSDENILEIDRGNGCIIL